ncbi:MAG TPA: hypothetical protein VM093_09260 [Aeromicrobium sp.]|nr:hypothetical protein [Aeromicrobium sp.]
MISLGSWAAWLVAVVIGVLTVPMLWVAQHIASEDGWVSFTAGFVEDEQLRDGVVKAAAGAMLARVILPPQTARLLDQSLEDLVRTAVEQPGFVEAWRESLRRTHRLTFGPDANSDRLVADIGPLATFIARDVSQQLPVRLVVPDRVVVPINKQPDPRLIERVAASPSRSMAGLIATGIALLVSMLLAGGVPGALLRFGLAFVAVSAVMFTATGVGLPRLLERAPAPTAFARQMRELLVAHASSSFDAWALTLGVIGAVATIGGVAGGALRRRA